MAHWSDQRHFDKALPRFKAKCEFKPHSGCVLWKGGTAASRNGTERTGVFWYRGKKVHARRWAAEYIHEIDVLGKEVNVTCDEPLCVQHLTANATGLANAAQFYVFLDLELVEPLKPRTRPEHEGPPLHEEPSWLS